MGLASFQNSCKNLWGLYEFPESFQDEFPVGDFLKNDTAPYMAYSQIENKQFTGCVNRA
jgi:hypothetical protein